MRRPLNGYRIALFLDDELQAASLVMERPSLRLDSVRHLVDPTNFDWILGIDPRANR